MTEIEKPEKRNRFDKNVDIEVSVTEEDLKKVEDVKQIDKKKANKKQEPHKPLVPLTDTTEKSEQVETVEKTTIVDGTPNTNINIVKQASNLKSNEMITKIIKKQTDEDKLADLMSSFPNKNKNEIVALFIEEIMKQKEKEIRRRMMGYKKTKSQTFKESKETFSIPVRPEMKKLLNIISLFSSSNKYIFFEELLLHAAQNFDFEADIEELNE